ncbi:hypothetical protein LJC71_05365 [Desulfosarcina sp. OttesenSCG-928-A07]|nr:hypothetical protein [Desulfosarcina sp. OttesenSCG-928-G17]MDL2329165.1 hypothetical protein [Desulfosarcina sp. OttesenSCG-928-A07]
MIANKKKFYVGLVLMAAFCAVLVGMFMPISGHGNGLEYLDNLYNSISKGSAYYIDAVKADVQAMEAPESLTLTLKMKSEQQAEETIRLFIRAGAQVFQEGDTLTVNCDIRQILLLCLNDAQSMYNNDGAAVSGTYGYNERAVLYNWHTALKAMDFDLKQQNQFAVAKKVDLVTKKAVETAYNYYGIQGQKISERTGVVAFSLIFYVVYTLWYGFGIMYMFEGVGMQLEH